VCRLPVSAGLPERRPASGFYSVVRTADEISIVCDESRIPEGARAESGWTAFKLEGPFSFQSTGVLASFLSPLAETQIPIFAISTFDTDYVLIRSHDLPQALETLSAAGHRQLDPES